MEILNLLKLIFRIILNLPQRLKKLYSILDFGLQFDKDHLERLLNKSNLQKQSLSITLENVEYLYPLNFFSMRAEGQDALMAYMDIQPANYN